MTRKRADPAPLYSDCFALCEWLLARLGDRASVLPERLCHDALTLLDHTLLALKNVERDLHLEEADIQLDHR